MILFVVPISGTLFVGGVTALSCNIIIYFMGLSDTPVFLPASFSHFASTSQAMSLTRLTDGLSDNSIRSLRPQIWRIGANNGFNKPWYYFVKMKTVEGEKVYYICYIFTLILLKVCHFCCINVIHTIIIHPLFLKKDMVVSCWYIVLYKNDLSILIHFFHLHVLYTYLFLILLYHNCFE